jgi:soluble lytic murein transglycosylase-like protein
MRYDGMRCAVLLSVFGLTVSFFLPCVSYADRFYLTEERLIEGILVREDTATVTFKLDGAGLWTLSRHSLHRVERENPGEYWMRLGERHARGNRIDRARDAFEKARQNSDTERQASRRLKDLDLLNRGGDSTPASETAVQIPKAEMTEEKSSSQKLAEIQKEVSPEVAPPPPPPPSPPREPAEGATKVTVAEKEAAPRPTPASTERMASAPRPSSREGATHKKAVVEDGKYSDLIRKYAQYHGVDPLLVKAIISVESRWNPRATSKSGAQGLMQLMPETAAALGVKDCYDPEENIRAGVKYLGELNKQFLHLGWRERQTHVVAAFNAGPNLIKEAGDYRRIPKAVQYTNKVMATYDELLDQKNAEFAYLDPFLGH